MQNLTRDIGIVVPNFNGWSDTCECVESLKDLLSKERAQIFIVDCKSTDSSLDYMRSFLDEGSEEWVCVSERQLLNLKLDEGIVLVEMDSNRGYAAAINVVLKYVLQTKYHDFVWIINNDTTVEPEALSSLIEYSITNPMCGMIGSTIMEYYAPNMVQCAGGAIYTASLSLNRSYLSGTDKSILLNADSSRKLDYICGAAMFLPIKAAQRVGLFNESYFLYYEEIDFAERLRKMDYFVGWCKESIVYHKGGKTIGSRSLTSKGKSSLSEYYSTLSALKYTWKFHPRAFPFMLVSRFTLKVLRAVMSRDLSQIKPIVKAYSHFFRSHFISDTA